MQITIYHNPDCGTSCNALAKLRKLGHEARIIEYMKAPLSRSQIMALIAQMDIAARDVVRRKEPLFRQLGLDDKDVTEDELLDALADNPVLINRPIVVLEDGANVTARLCRPSVLVLSLVKQAEPNP
jgi:arsenate reductase